MFHKTSWLRGVKGEQRRGLKDKQDTGGGGRRNCLISVSVRLAWPERAVVSSEKLLPAF